MWDVYRVCLQFVYKPFGRVEHKGLNTKSGSSLSGHVKCKCIEPLNSFFKGYTGMLSQIIQTPVLNPIPKPSVCHYGLPF